MKFLWLFVVCFSVQSASVRVLNLTGTNFLATNSTYAFSFPPGEYELNLESGAWDFVGTEISFSDSEYLEIVRVGGSAGSYTVDRALERPHLEIFLAGYISGWTIFGFAWMVSAIRQGIGVAVRPTSSDPL